MLNLHSADYAKLLRGEPGRYLLLERATPRGRLKGDLVTLKDAEGRDLETVPIAAFNDLVRSKVVYQESDDGAEAVFRPVTEDRKGAV